jgi:hypothetical protein
MGTPVWLLDIDGVINALGDPPDPSVWPEEQWLRATAVSAHDIEWPIVAALPVLEFLRQVHARRRAGIWWHSGWQGYAVNVGAALQLPQWPIRECPEYWETPLGEALEDSERPWWKLLAARRVLDAGRPLLWTDDDAYRQLGSLDTTGWGGPALIVCPDEEIGLTPAHLRQIDDWLPHT